MKTKCKKCGDEFDEVDTIEYCNPCYMKYIGRAMYIELKDVKSSILQKIGYDEEYGTLQVLWKSGKKYQYDRIPPNIFDEFMKAPSLGAYFTKNIRDKYKTKLLGG